MRNSEDISGKNLASGHNVTLSLKNIVKGGYTIRAPISPARRADVMATRNTVFIDKWRGEQAAISSHGDLIRHFRTGLRSQTRVGCLTGGKRFQAPSGTSLSLGGRIRNNLLLENGLP